MNSPASLGVAVRQSSENHSLKKMANDTNGTDEATDSTNKFVSALILNLIIALICLILFCLLRQKHKIIYAPRQLLVETLAPGRRAESFFSWVIPAFVVKDDEVFRYAGIDAVVHTRFMKLCLKIALVLMPYGIVVLIPVNYFGGADLSGLDSIALSNIVPKSPKVWAHVVAAWVYTLIICYLLYEEWKAFIVYRQEFLGQGLAQHYAVLVRDLPTKVSIDRFNYAQFIFFRLKTIEGNKFVLDDLKMSVEFVAACACSW